MKRYFLLIILTLLIVPIVANTPVYGQLLEKPDDIQKNTEEAAKAGNLTDVSIGILVAKGIQTVLSLLGVIFLGLTVAAGFKWMTASGNEEQIKKAINSLKAAIIGLLIVLAAYTITYFIFKALPFGMDSVNSTTTTSDTPTEKK